MANKNVLSCLLKDGKEVNAVMLVGRLFHARATVTGNDRSPMVLSRVRETIRHGQEPDSSRCRNSASSVRYEGALLRQQKASTASRNCISLAASLYSTEQDTNLLCECCGPQVMSVTNPVVSHYFPPGQRLSSQPRSIITLGE